MDGELVVAAAVMVAIAGFAGFMDHRRNNRDHLDRVGWVNWTLLMVLASMFLGSPYEGTLALIGAVMIVIVGTKL